MPTRVKEKMKFSCKYKLTRNSHEIKLKTFLDTAINKCRIVEFEPSGESELVLLNDKGLKVMSFPLKTAFKVESRRVNEGNLTLCFKEKSGDQLNIFFYKTSKDILVSLRDYICPRFVKEKAVEESKVQTARQPRRAALSRLEQIHFQKRQAKKTFKPKETIKELWKLLDDFALFGILQFLPPTERLSLSLITKRTKEVADLAKLQLNLKYQTDNRMIACLLNRFSMVEQLKFNGKITNSLMKTLSLPNIIDLDLSPCKFIKADTVEVLLSRMTNLQRIVLSAEIEHAQFIFKKLQKGHLRSLGLVKYRFSINYHTLERRELTNVPYMKEINSTLEGLLKASLRDLELFYFSETSLDFKRLKILRVNTLFSKGKASLRFIESCVNLESFELLHIVRENEEQVIKIEDDNDLDYYLSLFHTLPLLEEISLGTFTSDSLLYCLLKAAKKLKRIKVTSKEITDEGIEPLFSGQVEEADLRGCLGIIGNELVGLPNTGNLSRLQLSLNNFNYARVIIALQQKGIEVTHMLIENK